MGSHTRAFITDMRPKLFDGEWKENIGAHLARTSLLLLSYHAMATCTRVYSLRIYTLGGGDFVQMFGSDGKLQYWKELDPQVGTHP